MKLLVGGSRSITDYDVVCRAFEQFLYFQKQYRRTDYTITEVITGHQRGRKINGKWYPTVDLLAERWAKERNIAVKPVRANWHKHGKAAGPIRNGKMVAELAPDEWVLAIWDGRSRGTADLMDKARRAGRGVYTYGVTVKPI